MPRLKRWYIIYLVHIFAMLELSNNTYIQGVLERLRHMLCGDRGSNGTTDVVKIFFFQILSPYEIFLTHLVIPWMCIIFWHNFCFVQTLLKQLYFFVIISFLKCSRLFRSTNRNFGNISFAFSRFPSLSLSLSFI